MIIGRGDTETYLPTYLCKRPPINAGYCCWSIQCAFHDIHLTKTERENETSEDRHLFNQQAQQINCCTGGVAKCKGGSLNLHSTMTYRSEEEVEEDAAAAEENKTQIA